MAEEKKHDPETAKPDMHQYSFPEKCLEYLNPGYRRLISRVMYLLLLPLISMASVHLSSFDGQEVTELWLWNESKCSVLSIAVVSGLVFVVTVYFMKRSSKVYLVNFASYKPESDLMTPTEHFMDVSASHGSFTKENLAFQKKVLEKSGLGQKTYWPSALVKVPCNPCFREARKELEQVVVGAVDELFSKTRVRVRDIGILVVNCSLFNPTPSLPALIINHYKLRADVKSYNLGGMGCSAGLIAIDLAKSLLQVHGNTYALVVSAESGSLNWYRGNDRSMLIPNCIFRMGGAAMLLSNRSSDRRRSKYQLIHTLRTHKGSDDKAYGCVYQRQDENKIVGISLSKDLMAVAGGALKANITTLGPLVLPMSEQLLFLATWIGRKILRIKIKAYVPDFKWAFEHFCIHPGGKAVLDEVENSLSLSKWDMEPSRMALYRFGNTSSSALWYELAYAEAKGRIRKGDRIWQIAFGSGFKCNSAVWRALKTVNPQKEKNPWTDEIDEFPVSCS